MFLPTMLTLGGGVMGFGEALVWLGAGLADTLTGGALSLAPDEATRLSVEPLRPMFLADARRSTMDPCGRPAAATRP